jgi:hypothetical protein
MSRRSAEEDPKLVIARLRANEPQAPRGVTVNGRYRPPTTDALAAYQQRHDAWASSIAREEEWLRQGGVAAVRLDYDHEEAKVEDSGRG